MNINANSRLHETRLALRRATHADENIIAEAMLADFPLEQKTCNEIVETAHAIVTIP